MSKLDSSQEIFDRVITRLYDGKGQSASNGSCRYRTEDGNSCAVGCLIPDELYDPAMDNEPGGITVKRIFKLFPEVEKYFGSNNLAFLGHLQRIHDSQINWDMNMPNMEMRYHLKNLADLYKLEWTHHE